MKEERKEMLYLTTHPTHFIYGKGRLSERGNPLLPHGIYIFKKTVYLKVVLTGINDLPPAFTDDPYTITVKESAAINDVIMTIHAVDEDGDTVTYTVVESLASASGNDIILKESLDYETKSMAVITVQ